MNNQFAYGGSKLIHIRANGNRLVNVLLVGTFDVINKTDEVGKKDEKIVLQLTVMNFYFINGTRQPITAGHSLGQPPQCLFNTA